MLLASQIRAARSLLGWTARDLSLKSGVSLATIQRLEPQSGALACHPRTIKDLKRAFEEAGLEFIGTSEKGAGVKFQ